MAYGNPFRPNDAIDELLFAWEAKRKHEYRMQQIRELDVETWVANL
jgi:hypothetical protein